MEELYLLTFALVKESRHLSEQPSLGSDLAEIVNYKRVLRILSKVKQVKRELLDVRGASNRN